MTSAALWAVTEFTQEIKSHQYSLNYISTEMINSMYFLLYNLCFLTTSMTWALHWESSCMPCRAKSNSFLYSASVFWASWRPDPVTTYMDTNLTHFNTHWTEHWMPLSQNPYSQYRLWRRIDKKGQPVQWLNEMYRVKKTQERIAP